MKDKLNVIDGAWKFDSNVTKCFDDMLSRSIPDYSTMRFLVFKLGRHFINDEGGVVADIGCSNGLATEDFIKKFKKTKFILSDVSEPMLESCKDRYKYFDNVCVVNHDLRNGLAFSHANLVISCLTIQFTPIEYRQNIIQNIYDSIEKGGAFILIEKVLGNTSSIDNLLVEEYYNIKEFNGYSREQINNKRKSLEGVLVPLTYDFNVSLLKQAGFKKIDCFWRCLNFVGIIALK